MVLLGWFDAAQAGAFGEELARFCDSELRLIATASPGKLSGRLTVPLDEFDGE